MKTRPPTPTECEYCGRRITPQTISHLALCPSNPANYAKYAAALENLAHPGQAYTCSHFDVMHQKGAVYGSDALRRALGMTWAGVAEFFGLRPAPHGEGMRDAAKRRKKAKETIAEIGREIDEELEDIAKVAEEWEAARYGLPVLRVREERLSNGVVREYYMIR